MTRATTSDAMQGDFCPELAKTRARGDGGNRTRDEGFADLCLKDQFKPPVTVTKSRSLDAQKST